MHLTNIVFQGTVLGPALWNAFFSDVSHAVPQGNQIINLFADDLTVMSFAPQQQSLDLLQQELTEAQQRTHDWGRDNQVQFDPSKESFHFLHPSLGQGPDFRLFGTLVDCKMTMFPDIEQVLGKIRPKIRAMLRLRHLYSMSAMIAQFKTHIWSHLEYSNGALLLANRTQLKRLDKVQRWFLHELGITDTTVFVDFNFPPPSLRRAIGMLGFLHKRALGLCHPPIIAALPAADDHIAAGAFHNKALHSFDDKAIYQRRLYDRSLFAFIHMYNRLPQFIVDAATVSNFQSTLTRAAKSRAAAGDEHWRDWFQDWAHVDRWFV